MSEYVSAALWVMPFAAGLLAILLGVALSHLHPADGSWLAALGFRGSSGQARDLLVTITSTVVTVIALVLGLSVVALQLASTQYSPRLLRNFLRDRTNQVVLSVFMGTFAYSAAGLFTVGIGPDDAEYPRLAVSGAVAALFASLAGVVVFADHLSHSIQVDAIMLRVERQSVEVARHLARDVDPAPPKPPAWAVGIPASSSGYVVTVRPEALLRVAQRYGVSIALQYRVGQHVVASRHLAEVWTPGPDDPQPDLAALEHAIHRAVGIGFERTRQQDAAMGIRQLVDAACKALSPAVNDPYTAVQAVDHMSVIFTELARLPLGPLVVRRDPAVVVVPSRRFEEYLATMCGLVRRYGAGEPTVDLALLRLLENCAFVTRHDAHRLGHLAEQARLIGADAEREVRQPADLRMVRASEEALLGRIEHYRREPSAR
ncbi:DUF2254 domain-containing protein [Raineyella fluvialis]|uniref:DUF2254 domain-containing protein n=1 Tax=Raineyella fluvialis TaxID=2662261 RepID=A0A5Q2FKS0_9ACTN|nr:DUF2254 domain-containing protein [Raineyella fluvialis]QGF24936.1 DUF2254 domain-containing protein [Raineyella fluvialis]